MKKKKILLIAVGCIVLLIGLYFASKFMQYQVKQKRIWLSQVGDVWDISHAVIEYADRYKRCPDSMQTLVDTGYIWQYPKDDKKHLPPKGMLQLYNPYTDYIVTSPKNYTSKKQFEVIYLAPKTRQYVSSIMLENANSNVYLHFKEKNLLPKQKSSNTP